jgi:hypothetical protein
MPNDVDFNSFRHGDIYTMDIQPNGWVPLTIEYTTGQAHNTDPLLSVCWRIKGTTHLWTIYEQHLNQISKANYKSHFIKILENFRVDYIEWTTNVEFMSQNKWVNEYAEQYDKFIKK